MKSTVFDLLASTVLTALLFAYGSGASVGAGMLSCSVTTAAACTGGTNTIMLRMSSSTNAHAELPSQSNAAYDTNVICCNGLTLSTNCSGPAYATFLKLSSTTNAQVAQNTDGTFTNNACFSVTGGGVATVGYGASCASYDTTMASISAASNAHIGTSTVYATKVCASAEPSSLTFITDSSAVALPDATPGVLTATSSILMVTTNSTNGYNITLVRNNAVSTLTQGAVSMPDKTDWMAPGATTTAGGATASTTLSNRLQFRVRQGGTDTGTYASAWWGSDDTTANALFAGIPSTTQMILSRNTAAVATSTSYVLYNLIVPSSQKSGAYSGSVTFTAISN